jgi:heterotetrameric sarcosine oxidase gamma subunit
MKFTTLDLHPRAFKAGMAAGSMFGRAHATLWQVTDDAAEGGSHFRLIVRWSMADYLWCLIADAAREFGTPETLPIGGETLTIA